MRTAIERIREIYDTLPTITCQRKCAHCCRGIQLTPVENEQIRRRKGVGIPEPEKLADARLRNGPNRGSHLVLWGNIASAGAICPLLNAIEGTCTVHDIRPLICRLWGVTETMRCPEPGCIPSRILTDKESFLLLNEVGYLGGMVSEAEYQEGLERVEDPEIWPWLQARMRAEVTYAKAEKNVMAIIERRRNQ